MIWNTRLLYKVIHLDKCLNDVWKAVNVFPQTLSNFVDLNHFRFMIFKPS